MIYTFFQPMLYILHTGNTFAPTVSSEQKKMFGEKMPACVLCYHVEDLVIMM